jgi:hypothetical protein
MSRVVVALFLFASTLFAQNVDTELLHHFDYDQKAPLDVQEVREYFAIVSEPKILKFYVPELVQPPARKN